MQRSQGIAAPDGGLGGACGGQRLVLVQGYKGVQGAAGPDPVKGGLDGLDRRDAPPRDILRQGGCGHVCQIGHAVVLPRIKSCCGRR